MTPHNRSTARSRIHELGDCKGGPDCDLLIDLLNRVEDDHAHAEAQKLRDEAAGMVFDLLDPFSPQKEGWLRHIAERIDPYEERDGQLVRKLDGKPVTI